jgi:UDP:flavonoid glycosyltransferase YjiC (YdhE family)
LSVIVVYVSGHGLGHVTREIALINSLASRRAGLRFVVRTAAPRWVIDAAALVEIDVQQVETDTGVVQIDSIRLDEEDTARRAGAFYTDFAHRVSAEAVVLRSLAATLVVGDIPPLAFAAAAAARVPSIAIGNFTWDWIYGSYPSFSRLAPGVISTIEQAYAQATRALRLPLHGGFAPMAAVTENIPFIARKSRRGRAEARRVLGIGDGAPVVLSSFGGYGVELPLETLRGSDRFVLLTAQRRAPHGLRYEDLVAAADVVVSKPGYGIVSECLANDTALLYTDRGRFIEYDVFVSEMPDILRCRHISQDDLLAGRWADAVDAVLAQPPPPRRAPVDGAEVASDAILKWIE